MQLTNAQIERLDEIDNAVFDCICTLAEQVLEWDMYLIGEVTDVIKTVLAEQGIHVRHPGILHHEDGTEEYAE